MSRRLPPRPKQRVTDLIALPAPNGAHLIRSHPASIPPAVRAEGDDEAVHEGARRGALKTAQVGENVASKVEQMELER